MNAAVQTHSMRAKFPWLGQNLFCSPPSAGRRITAGFTYIQRIGKAAGFEVWVPNELKERVDRCVSASLGADLFPVEWAAVRHFELLQESGNHKIYDLDPSNIQRALRDLSANMRAGGYTITVVTLGHYLERSSHDELAVLDQSLQERISRLIHMIYLEAQSEDVNARVSGCLQDNKWDYREMLPHIAMVLGSYDLLRHPSSRKKKGKTDKGGFFSLLERKHSRAKLFFEILAKLPQNHIVHDTAIGLQLPEFDSENQWNYIASPDETLAAFNRVLGDLFDRHTFHLRGYGDRITDRCSEFYQSAALALG